MDLRDTRPTASQRNDADELRQEPDAPADPATWDSDAGAWDQDGDAWPAAPQDQQAHGSPLGVSC
jgi:hypothetical protein